MNQFLLDSNILIYLLEQQHDISRFIEQYREATFFISVVSWIEVLAGSMYHHKTMLEVEEELRYFSRLPIDDRIAKYAAQLFDHAIRKGGKIKKFQDGIIAATALLYGIPLLTNNPKDFRRFKGLKVILPKK